MRSEVHHHPLVHFAPPRHVGPRSAVRVSCRVPTFTQGNRMRISSCRPAGPLAAALFLAAAITQPLAAQSGSLQGRVTDTAGTVVVGATVTVDQTGLRTTASARGAYTLNGVPACHRVARTQ